MLKKIFLMGAILTVSLTAFADINLYGPGGTHTALQKVAKKYEEKTGIKVNVNFGPQSTWNERAKVDADILFGSSEQSAIAIADDHKERFDVNEIEPLYLRRAIILVKKGNPKKIKGLKDLANKKVGIIAPEGMGKSNTSGTGAWEDMIGRTKNIDIVKKFRKNIVSFTPNSGTARNLFLNDDKVDAWITWIDWAKSNPGYGDIVEIEKDLVVYRDLNLVARKNANKEILDFIKFAESKEVESIYKELGWER